MRKFTNNLIYIPYFIINEIYPEDERARANAENFIATSGVIHADKVIVRMPMIPTFNFEHDLIIKSIDYVASLGAKEINLLPYHSLGKVKYEKMGMTYELPVKMMENKELEEYHQYALRIGLKSKIGG